MTHIFENGSISWCENFVERRSFRIVSGESRKLYGNCAFPQNIHTRKLSKIMVYYEVNSFDIAL